MASEFGKHISEKLRELSRDCCKEANGANNPLPFARECVDHYYGLDTDNFGIDLSMEHQHLLYFRDHIINHCGNKTVRNDTIIALNNYMAELMKLNIELNRRGINGEE